MTATETATRLADVIRGDLPKDLDGDDAIAYWFDGVEWWIYLPRGGVGRLSKHKVEENEDGTITVRPSIGMRKGAGFVRHGFLTRGQWREV